MVESFSLYKLLMWKQGVSAKRSILNTVLRFLMPMIFIALVVFLRSKICGEPAEELRFKSFTTNQKPGNEVCRPKDKARVVMISPESEVLKNIISKICHGAEIKTFESSSKLEAELSSNSNLSRHLLLAVKFNDEFKGISDTKNVPPDVQITLRLPSLDDEGKKKTWTTGVLYPLKTPGARLPKEDVDDFPDYQKRGFLYLQQAITSSLINYGVKNDTSLDLNLKMQKFPYPKWSGDTLYANGALQHIFALAIALFFFAVVPISAIEITKEKELQLKASLRLMGVPRWVLWSAYFTYYFIVTLVVTLFVFVLLTFKILKCPVLPYSDKVIFLLFCLVANCASITLAFLISTLFMKASTVAALADNIGIITLIPFLLNMSKFQSGSAIPLGEVIGESLFLCTGISYGIVGFLRLENEGGVDWDTLWKSTIEDDGITVGLAFVMLIVDTIIYMLIAIYLEAVFPGPFETRQPANFFCTKNYWSSRPPDSDTDNTSISSKGSKRVSIELEPINESKGIEIIGVTKMYGTNIVVNNFTLNVYEGQITALLGHNGAGKSTTVSMISGMIQPTRGTIKIYGYDIKTNGEKVRKLIGVCPQHNVLFEYMTVGEHLYFFCRLKGASSIQAKQQVKVYLELLELKDKEKVAAAKLSGGMKRKLSIGIAMCGDSKLVILDEPTAALDPAARRVIWNLIQSQREGRTILLITHFMDEADILGDRIAIMTAGRLKCYGTGFFLKKKYGTGYYLTIEMAPKCRPKDVTSAVRSYIPSAKLYSQTNTDITYQLPDNDSSKFPGLLSEIEQRMSELRIRSYGISPATLEEVFLKVGDNEEIRNLKNTTPRSSPYLKSKSGLYSKGIALWRYQIVATLAKKIIYMFRMWHLYLFTQVIIPILLILWIMLSNETNPDEKLFKPLTITLDSYKDPVTVLGGERNNYTILFEKVVGSQNVKKVGDCSKEILNQISESPINVIEHYIVAVCFTKTTATAMFNSIPYHSPPLALALLLNTMYKTKFGESHSITFVNEPLPVPPGVKDPVPPVVTQALIYGILPIVMVVIIFYIKERMIGVKHLQLCSGLSPLIYWLVSFIFDFTLYFLAILIVLLVALILEENTFEPPERAKIIFLILTFFGVYIITLSYFLSSFIKTNEMATFIISFLWMAGLVGILVFPYITNEDGGIMEYVDWILIFTPFYSLATAFLISQNIYNTKQACMKLVSLETACKLEPQCCVPDYYATNKYGIGRQILVSFGMGILLFLVVLCIDYYFLRKLTQSLLGGKRPKKTAELDSDVEEEKNKIMSMKNSELKKTHILVLKSVTKYYGKLLAVNNICVGVKPYECFGLLGANGAGKTTTFEMMNGKNRIPYGDIHIGGYSLKTDMNKVQEMTGYCPQFDALFGEFTTKETLTFFALIHGVPDNRLKERCDYYAEMLDFSEHMNKKVSQLSGGNRRKLSVSVALMGSPLLLFLDEPTGAMDPAAKRNVWNALAKARDEGKSIVLTSHSMEECEVLCTRIAIMVKGQFMCLGSTQRLKSKFAQGYSVKIKIKKGGNLEKRASNIIRYMNDKFPRTVLEERYQELLTFKLDASIRCSRIFKRIEEVKHELRIEDYSVQQCSLEQVFLSLTENSAK